MLKVAKDSVDVGLIVSNIGASLKFYKDILGLAFVETVPLPFGTMHRLRFGTTDIKLVDPTTVPPSGAIGLDKQLGIRYVTFVIGNLSQVCQELIRQGVEFTMPEHELRPGVRIAMVKDPDGNIVEFKQNG